MVTENEDSVSVLGQLLEDEENAEKGGAKKEVAPDLDALQRQLDYEKQRNDSLQGRVDSQLKPLTQTVRELRDQLNTAQPGTVEPAPKEVTVQDLLAELTPEEREAVGEKQLAVLARLVEKPTQTAIDKVRRELQASFDARLQMVEGQIRGQTGQDLWAKVEELSPGALGHNNSDDPRWVDYLNQIDPISGRSRKELGNAAVDAGDVARLALLHDEFLKASGQDKKEAGEVAAGKANDLSRELRPEGSQVEPTGEASDKPTIKGSEVEKFYKDLADGKYTGRPEVANKMETLITSALQDGRVL